MATNVDHAVNILQSEFQHGQTQDICRPGKVMLHYTIWSKVYLMMCCSYFKCNNCRNPRICEACSAICSIPENYSPAVEWGLPTGIVYSMICGKFAVVHLMSRMETGMVVPYFLRWIIFLTRCEWWLSGCAAAQVSIRTQDIFLNVIGPHAPAVMVWAAINSDCKACVLCARFNDRPPLCHRGSMTPLSNHFHLVCQMPFCFMIMSIQKP